MLKFKKRPLLSQKRNIRRICLCFLFSLATEWSRERKNVREKWNRREKPGIRNRRNGQFKSSPILRPFFVNKNFNVFILFISIFVNINWHLWSLKIVMWFSLFCDNYWKYHMWHSWPFSRLFLFFSALIIFFHIFFILKVVLSDCDNAGIPKSNIFVIFLHPI